MWRIPCPFKKSSNASHSEVVAKETPRKPAPKMRVGGVIVYSALYREVVGLEAEVEGSYLAKVNAVNDSRKTPNVRLVFIIAPKKHSRVVINQLVSATESFHIRNDDYYQNNL